MIVGHDGWRLDAVDMSAPFLADIRDTFLPDRTGRGIAADSALATIVTGAVVSDLAGRLDAPWLHPQH